jgi:hypothetical protein
VEFARELAEERLQERRIDQALRLRKAAQAHRLAADLALHALQRAGGRERPHGAQDRVDQPK